MESKIPEALEEILSNNTAGSTELLEHLNGFFLHNPGKKDHFGEYISLAYMRLTTFASIQNYLKELKAVLENQGPEEVRSFLLKTETGMKSFYQRLYQNAKPVIGNFHSVITISNSYTLTQVFKLWQKVNPSLRVFIAESRPKCEGRIMAEKLLSFGIRVEFILDSMTAEYTALADGAIIGADMVLSNGNVVNKSGSMLLALAAKHYNRPFIVLTGKDKFSSNQNYTLEEYPAEEVWAYRHENLKVTNHYFEEVEKDLITHIITD
ncbi:MAG TPA: hypothetical protein VHO03_13685 [Ignavibacteriales bacterium]|nr:hypothetical protein [Ignavibacteriales bacterium]